MLRYVYIINSFFKRYIKGDKCDRKIFKEDSRE
jgi:hypothetical protein